VSLAAAALVGCGAPRAGSGERAAPASAAHEARDTAAVAAQLDRLHAAAARADGADYFECFTPEAVFVGTDATERWTLEQFRAYAEPYFDAGRGWTYTALERHVAFDEGGDTAWFDERLWNATYGECRGSGVLVLGAGGWRVAHYVLSFPIPNDLAPRMTSEIRAASGR
jgi:hypothetical protein